MCSLEVSGCICLLDILMKFWLVEDMLNMSQETLGPKIRKEKEKNIVSLAKTFNCFSSPLVYRKPIQCIRTQYPLWTDLYLGCACRVRQSFPACFAPNPYSVHLPVVAETMESRFMGWFAASGSHGSKSCCSCLKVQVYTYTVFI